jgi:carbonic anhydrase
MRVLSTWDYGVSQGTGHWGELKPEFAPCKNGHRQSPIDIRNPQKTDLPAIQSITSRRR